MPEVSEDLPGPETAREILRELLYIRRDQRRMAKSLEALRAELDGVKRQLFRDNGQPSYQTRIRLLEEAMKALKATVAELRPGSLPGGLTGQQVVRIIGLVVALSAILLVAFGRAEVADLVKILVGK